MAVARFGYANLGAQLSNFSVGRIQIVGYALHSPAPPKTRVGLPLQLSVANTDNYGLINVASFFQINFGGRNATVATSMLHSPTRCTNVVI